MLRYYDGTEVHIGDGVFHAGAKATVEAIVEGDEISRWGIERAGFLLLCEQCGMVLIEPGSLDWEDVSLVGREVG